MGKRLGCGLILVLLAGCGVENADSSLHDIDIQSVDFDFQGETYENRLAQVASLAIFYPGVPKPSSHRDGLGLWAGIQVQTQWQMRTERTKYAHWRLPNGMLTTFPYLIAKAQRTGEDYCAAARDWQASASSTELALYFAACASWQDFFDHHQDGRATESEKTMQKLMWRAHTASLKFIETAAATHLTGFSDQIPQMEYHYWRGWMKFVFALDDANFPTKAKVVSPLNSQFLAPCGPLGSSQCQQDRLPLATQTLMARYLIDESTSMSFLINWISKLLRPFS